MNDNEESGCGRKATRIRGEFTIGTTKSPDEIETTIFDKFVEGGMPHEVAAEEAHQLATRIIAYQGNADEAQSDLDAAIGRMLVSLRKLDTTQRRIIRLWLALLVIGGAIELVWLWEMWAVYHRLLR